MIAAPAPHRTRLPLAAAGAALALLGLSACGGGDELAPPDPQVEGPGMAVVQLGGVEVGSTPLVTSGLASTRDLTVEAAGEVVTFEGDPPVARLSRTDLAPSVPGPCEVSVVQTADPTQSYTQGCDYSIDSNNGLLQSMEPDPAVDCDGDGELPDGIPAGTEVTVDYCYFDAVYTVAVGIALPEGDFFELDFHNIPAGTSENLSTSRLAATAPGDGSLAYFATAAQDLTILNGARFTAVDDPAMNLATIIAADLSNALNPCIEGTVVTAVRNDSTGEQTVLEVDFDDPDCPL